MSKHITKSLANSCNTTAHRPPSKTTESHLNLGRVPEPLGLNDRAISNLVLQWLAQIFEEVREINASGANKDLPDRAIRLPELISIMGLSKSAIYDRLNPKSLSYQSDMPRPFKLGNSDRSPVVWWHHEVVAYLKSRADLQRNS